MRAPDTNSVTDPGAADAAAAIALSALAWTLSEGARAGRLLALTGLDSGELRARAADPALLAATIGFLAGHEADLVACADALGVAPAALIAAQRELER
ncbi:MAG TPA: DUF3572 family protein [Sphingomonas sp.]